MRPCPDKLELRNLLNSEIDPQRRNEIDAHIESCGTCQATLDALTDESTLDIPGLANRSARPALGEPISKLVSRLQESPPIEVLSDESTPQVDEVVEFPGEPTSDAPLGVLGPYRILERIGGGATGLVYRAIDSRLDRQVAIKVLRGSLAVSASARARLEREARAAASLTHDHIVTLFGIENRLDFPPYLVMEYVEGTSLGDRLSRETRLPPTEAAQIVREIALALAAAADRGLVHRDIKPSNILLDRSSRRAKISDFGLVCAEEPKNRLTVDGAIAGTPAYMSPEQIDAPTQVDSRSDIYSLGVVLYELLTGDVPFRGVVRMTLHQVLHDDPRPPRQLNDTIPRDLETVCLKAMAKEPSQRYQTPGDLADDLERWIEHQPILARPVSPAGRLWRWCKRSPRVAALSAAVVVLLLSVAAISVTAAVYLASAHDQAEDSQQASAKSALEAERQRDLALQTLRKLIFQVHNQLEKDEVVLEEAQRKLLRISLDGLRSVATTSDDRGVVDYSTAEAHARLGTILMRLEEPDEAKEQFDAAKRIALRMLDDDQGDDRLRKLLAETHFHLGSTAMMREKYDMARASFEKALDIYRQLAEDAPTDAVMTKSVAKVLFRLGDADYFADKDAQAVPYYKECLGLLEDLAGRKTADQELVIERISCRMSLGLAYYHANDYEFAEQHLRKVVVDAEAASAPENQTRTIDDAADAFNSQQRLEQVLRCSAIAHRHLASIGEEQGQRLVAEQEFQRSLTDSMRLYKLAPWDTTVAALVTTAYDDLITLASGNNEQEMVRKHRDALEAFLAMAIERFPDNHVAKAALADNAIARAVALLVEGETTDAKQRFNHAAELATELHSVDPLDLDVAETLVQAFAGLAQTAETDGNRGEAAEWLDRAFGIVQQLEDAPDKPDDTSALVGFVKDQRTYLGDVALQIGVAEVPE